MFESEILLIKKKDVRNTKNKGVFLRIETSFNKNYAAVKSTFAHKPNMRSFCTWGS